MPESKTNSFGFECPIRGCKQKHNRRFITAMGVVKHIEEKHPGELVKRLKLKESVKKR